MMSGLVSQEELAGLRETADLGRQSQVEIYERGTSSDGFSSDADSYPDTPTQTVLGWLRTVPDVVLTDAFDAVQHPEEGRLFLDTSVEVNRTDKLRIFPLDDSGNVVEPGADYRVIDTNRENTYRIFTRVAVRRLT